VTWFRRRQVAPGKQAKGSVRIADDPGATSILDLGALLFATISSQFEKPRFTLLEKQPRRQALSNHAMHAPDIPDGALWQLKPARLDLFDGFVGLP
jgi:hypothetical protein